MKHFIVQNPSIEELQKISQEYGKDAFVTFFATDIEVIKKAIEQELLLTFYCIIDNQTSLENDLSIIEYLKEHRFETEIKWYKNIPNINQKIFEYIPNIKVSLLISKEQAKDYISLLQELHNLKFKRISISPIMEDSWEENDWAILREQIKYYCDFLGQKLTQGEPYVRLYDFENMCQKILFSNLKCLTQHEPNKCTIEDNCLRIVDNKYENGLKCDDCAMHDVCNFVVSCQKVKSTQINNINQCEWNKILIHNILYFFTLFELIETDEYFTKYMNFLLRG